MTQDTRQFVIKLFSIAIVVFSGAILAVLLFRAWVDGNAPLTAQITQGLINELPYLLGFLAAIIIGEPVGTALVARALPAILGGMASAIASGASSSATTTTTTNTTTKASNNGNA